MEITKFISFVVDLSKDILEGRLDGYEVEYFWKNGGCYEFSKILKHYYPSSLFMINDKLDHCVVNYQGKNYDTLGEVTENNYQIAKQEDIDYMERNFGRDGFKDLANIFIEEIKECRIK